MRVTVHSHVMGEECVGRDLVITNLIAGITIPLTDKGRVGLLLRLKVTRVFWGSQLIILNLLTGRIISLISRSNSQRRNSILKQRKKLVFKILRNSKI